MGGQSGQAVALELIVVLLVVEVILYRSIRDALRTATSAHPWLLLRTVGSFACLLIEQAGAVALFLGHAPGLYAVGLGMMASFVFMVSGAWLLLVGVGTSEPSPARA